MQERRTPDLLTQIGGGVDQEPAIAILADGQSSLRAGRNRWVALSGPAAARAVGVPLRKSAARGRPQHRDPHWFGLDLGADVEVDLGAARRFDDDGFGPSHLKAPVRAAGRRVETSSPRARHVKRFSADPLCRQPDEVGRRQHRGGQPGALGSVERPEITHHQMPDIDVGDAADVLLEGAEPERNARERSLGGAWGRCPSTKSK